MNAYCEEYKAFLDIGKTERLCAAEAVHLAEQAGYVPFTRGMAARASGTLMLLFLAIIVSPFLIHTSVEVYWVSQA